MLKQRPLLSSVNVLAPVEGVLPTALSLAQQIIANSPDAVQSTKQALLLSQSMGHNDVVHRHVWSDTSRRVYKGKNIKVRLYGNSYFVTSRRMELQCIEFETDLNPLSFFFHRRVLRRSLRLVLLRHLL